MSLRTQMSRTFRRSLLVAIPVATVVGATALVYAALNTFSSGQTLSSSLMNANFSNLDARLKALEAASGVSVSNDGGTTGLPVFVPPGRSSPTAAPSQRETQGHRRRRPAGCSATALP